MTCDQFLTSVRGSSTELEQIEGSLIMDDVDRQWTPAERAKLAVRKREIENLKRKG